MKKHVLLFFLFGLGAWSLSAQAPLSFLIPNPANPSPGSTFDALIGIVQFVPGTYTYDVDISCVGGPCGIGSCSIDLNVPQNGIDGDFCNVTLTAPNTAGTYSLEAIITGPGCSPCVASTSFSIVLPVELTRFEGKAIDDNVTLFWETATELNNSHFTILHSADGRSFAPIATIEGMGTTNTPQRYQWRHKTPYPGQNYYQLEQVDFDGQTDRSEIITVTQKVNAGAGLFVFPNPAETHIEIRSDLAIDKIDVFDAMGRRMATLPGLNETQARLSIQQGWPNGLYTLRAKSPQGKVSTQRLLIQR
jgi:hypothetical protein